MSYPMRSEDGTAGPPQPAGINFLKVNIRSELWPSTEKRVKEIYLGDLLNYRIKLSMIIADGLIE